MTNGLIGKEKHWGGSFICPSCGLPRKRRKFPLTSTCRWCRWTPSEGNTGSIDGLPDRIAYKIKRTADCWLWLSTLNKRGYAEIGRGGHDGGMVLAHRVIYQLLVGPIPEGYHLHHRETCPHNCVNPWHLTPKTIHEHARLHPLNAAAQWEKMRNRTHCRMGHELTFENTYIHPKTKSRKCRTCRRSASIRDNDKRREKRRARRESFQG